MVQSYKKKHEVREHYDTIIIGSGMGGLTTGALLAKQGQNVLVLEQHYTAGGFTHVFKRKGYEWDVGIHYIGEMQRESSVLKQLFDYITDGTLKWADMGEVYDRIIIGKASYDMVKGVNNFKAKLISYFPEEKQAIDAYVDLVFKTVKASRSFYMAKVMPSYITAIVGRFLRRSFYKYSDKTTYEVLRSLTANERLIKVLTGQYGDYGLPPKQSSFAMHASVVRHYFDGGSFPVGGSSKVLETIDPVIEKAGGTILVSAAVKEIIVNNTTAVGVLMEDGKTFRANTVVSNAGIVNTYKQLLPKPVVNKHKLTAQLSKVTPSVAHASLYIGLNGTPEELDLPKTNFWVYPEGKDHDTCVEEYLKDLANPLPLAYLSFPSAKDPDWSNRYPGKSTIDVITLVPYDAFESWEGTRWKKRGEEYEQKKDYFAQRLLEEVYRQLPQVKGKVDCYELSTPLSTKHFTNYHKGEIYGLDHSPQRFRQNFLKPKTAIKNLYLTGQDIVTCGVGGALFSGVLTASAVTKKNLLKTVLDS